LYKRLDSTKPSSRVAGLKGVERVVFLYRQA